MPAYNLERTIAMNVERVSALLKNELSHEIIVVNDGSVDRTQSELDAVAERIPEVKVVKLEPNAGKGAAWFRGFALSTGSHILLLDADLDLPPEQAAGFFDVMQESGADIVIGSKRHPSSQLAYPVVRKVASAAYFGMVRFMFGLPVADTQTGIKLFRREVLSQAAPLMRVRRFAVDLELLAIAHINGWSIQETPVHVDFSHEGWGCLRLASVVRIVLDTLGVFFRAKVMKRYRAGESSSTDGIEVAGCG